MKQKYTKELILNELRRFYEEFGRIPKSSDFEKLASYPSRKTITNSFDSFEESLRLAGFDIKEKPARTRDFLLNEIKRYIKEFGVTPNASNMDGNKDYPCKKHYANEFGSWNNALKELGLLNCVSHYTDEELEFYFRKFVEINGRIPVYMEFNNTKEYPSFWCYQNRFGSWNNAVKHYGFRPNEGIVANGARYDFEDGEICKSRYEFDVSSWFRKNDIYYTRDVPYKDIIDTYNGKMDCDYEVKYNNNLWYIEVAGMYSPREKLSDVEIMYMRKLRYKQKLLCNSELNYKIIYPHDLKSHSLDEIFSFLLQ